MIKPSHLSLLDRYWAGLIGCNPVLLQAKSHVVFVSDTFPGVAAIHKNAWVIAVSHSVETEVGERLLSILESKASALEIEQSCVELLSSIGQTNTVGPSSLQYISSSPIPATHTLVRYMLRQLYEQDDVLVAGFLANLMAYREYTVLDRVMFPYVVGVFDNCDIVAMGAVRVWDGFIGEIFLDTLPHYMGKGIGVKMGWHLIKWILEQPGDMVAQYDTEISNLSSLRVAQKLGFQRYARLLMTNIG
jgi:GNAT superfamily N-acetyltransferase